MGSQRSPEDLGKSYLRFLAQPFSIQFRDFVSSLDDDSAHWLQHAIVLGAGGHELDFETQKGAVGVVGDPLRLFGDWELGPSTHINRRSVDLGERQVAGRDDMIQIRIG